MADPPQFGMAGQTTYEVYVLQGTRWEIHSRYNAVQKDAAIQEAKSLEVTPNIDATKVVKEIYNAKDGVSEEYTIYKSEALKKKTPTVREVFAAAPNSAARAARAAADPPAPHRTAKPKRPATRRRAAPKRRQQKKSSILNLVVKVLLVMLFSMTVAAVSTAVGAMNLPYTDLFGISMAGNSRTNVLFIVFVVSFVLSALMTAKSVLKKSDFNRSPPRSAAAPLPTPPAPLPLPQEQQAFPLPAEEPATEPPEVEAEQEQEAEKEQEKEKAEAEAAGSPPLSPETEQQKLYMMKFLGDSLGHVHGGAQKMDNFHKFGVNLYLAGAIEALAKQKNLKVASGLSLRT